MSDFTGRDGRRPTDYDLDDDLDDFDGTTQPDAEEDRGAEDLAGPLSDYDVLVDDEQAGVFDRDDDDDEDDDLDDDDDDDLDDDDDEDDEDDEDDLDDDDIDDLVDGLGSDDDDIGPSGDRML